MGRRGRQLITDASLRELLRTGRSLIGTFVHIASPELVEIIGHAGFDFVIIDTEHGPFGMETAVDLMRAADAVGIHPVIRVSDNTPSLICKALDIGAEGVLVPQVTSKEEAQAAVRAARYHPQGQRGVFPYMRASAYSAQGGAGFYERANRETALLLLVEGVAGVDNLADILTVPGVDLIFIGPMDLSQSVGMPGQVDHPMVQEKIRRIVQQAGDQGIVTGIYAFDLAKAKQWMAMGVRFVAFYVDSAIIYGAYRDIAEVLASDGADQGSLSQGSSWAHIERVKFS